MQTRRGCLLSLAAVAALAPMRRAQAESWPQRPVRIVVPFPAGGNTDTIARLIGQRLGEALGQQFVVENRAGAAGAIAAETVVRSPADGHTLLMATLGQMAVVPATTRAPYNPIRDFAPISNIGTNPFVLAVHPGVPARTLTEFIAYVRAQPSGLTYAAAGAGDLIHLATALFLKRAGLELTPVMYKGSAPALADVIAGHVPIHLSPLSGVLPAAAAGAVRLLAVSSEKRAPQIPDVPTFIESGFPGFKILTWNGLVAPAGTPAEIIDRVHHELTLAVRDPAFAERLVNTGVDPLGNSPEEFAAMIAADVQFWAEAVKIAGVQPN